MGVTCLLVFIQTKSLNLNVYLQLYWSIHPQTERNRKEDKPACQLPKLLEKLGCIRLSALYIHMWVVFSINTHTFEPLNLTRGKFLRWRCVSMHGYPEGNPTSIICLPFSKCILWLILSGPHLSNFYTDKTIIRLVTNINFSILMVPS